MKTNFFLSFLFIFSFYACKKPAVHDPVSALNGLVKEYGYIGHQNPLQESGTGVLLGGSPKKLAFVAPAEHCFPKEELERFYDTQHFSKSYRYLFQGSLGFTTFGSALFSAGLKLSKDMYVEIELDGLTIEYLSSIAISEWYHEGLGQTCKSYLDQVGFIIQALKTDKLTIILRTAKGVTLSLDSGMLNQYIRILPNVNYEIVEGYKVVITTPKYIGYQLGRLRQEDQGQVLYRAMQAENDKFVFEPISVFESDPEPSSLAQLVQDENNLDINHLNIDKNSRFLDPK